MSAEIIHKVHVINARSQKVGRLASRVAYLLQGKNKAVYAPNRDSGETVIINNINEAVFSGKKIGQKKYFHYSGYPGGLRQKTLMQLWTKNPAATFVNVVRQMLPDNTLRKKWLKRLKFQ